MVGGSGSVAVGDHVTFRSPRGRPLDGPSGPVPGSSQLSVCREGQLSSQCMQLVTGRQGLADDQLAASGDSRVLRRDRS